MRKYLIGALIGIVLSISATTYADDITNLIGRTVQGVFPVKVDGDTLAKTAIVIDGTSYLPVRAIGDAIGYDVSFNADLGITLNKKEGVEPLTTTSSSSEPSPTVTPEAYKNIDFLNNSIDGANLVLNTYEGGLKLLVEKGEPDGPKAVKYRELIESTKTIIRDLEQKKAALTP